jgi:hypothetical protein
MVTGSSRKAFDWLCKDVCWAQKKGQGEKGVQAV